MSITFLYTGDSYPAWLTCAVGLALVLLTGAVLWQLNSKFNEEDTAPDRPRPAAESVDFLLYGGTP